MARPPEQSRNANTNDSEGKPKVRKVKKSEGSAANSKGVDLARTAPVYSPLAVPLAGSASASTSTDSLQNPASSFRSQSANSFSANEPRHHSQITLPKGEDASKKRSSESAGDRKGKKKATPTYTTIAGSHRRDIADAVRNAGLTGTPAAPVSFIIPSKAATNTRNRSDSNLLAMPASNTAILTTQDRRGGSASQDLSRTVSANTAASASTSSLAGTVASTSSRPRADNDSQKSAKKKKKKKESASQAPAAQPISGAAGVTVTVLPAQDHARTAGTRSRPPTSRPAITAETQLRTLRPVTPSNTSLRSQAASVNGQAAASDHLPDLEHDNPTTATNLPSQAQNNFSTSVQPRQTSSTRIAPANEVGAEPPPPPWSAPLSTITLAFTPMHAYLAEFDPEPSSPLSPNTSRLVGPESHPSPAARQQPPIPNSPPPAFRSRTPSPTPEEQIEWPDVDADVLTLYERGYNSSETSLELMDDLGRARVAPNKFADGNDAITAHYWDARQWEAWRRAGLQLDERLKRMEAKGKYKAVEQNSREILEQPAQALPTNESTLLPLAEQAASAGSSASTQLPSHAHSEADTSIAPVVLSSPYPTHASIEPEETSREPVTSSAPQHQAPSPTQLASRLQGKLAQGTSRFPSIGSVRRARLKRFEEQRKESKNLTSVIEADARTSSPPVPVTPSSDSFRNAESAGKARSSITEEEVKDRRESITSGLDRLEALLRRGSKRTSATSDPASRPAAQSISSPTLPIEFSDMRAESMSSQEPVRAAGDQQGPSSPKPKPEETPSQSSYMPPTSTTSSEPVLEESPGPGGSESSSKRRTSGIAQILSDQIEARRSDSPGRTIRDASQTFSAVSDTLSDSHAPSVDLDGPSKRAGIDSDEVVTRMSLSTPPQLHHQQHSEVTELQAEAQEAIDALAQLEASEEQARIQQQVAEDARLAAELQSQMLRATPAEPQPTANLPIARVEQTGSASVPRKVGTVAKVQRPVTRQGEPSARKNPTTRNEIVVKSPSEDIDRLPVLTLPRAPPRVTTDPLSADNLRRLSRHPPKAPSLHSARSASSSSSNEGDLSLSPIASDSSDSDSADGESTARPPASSLLSYTAGSLPPSVSGSRFDSTSEREVAAASWRRSEDGRRASAILSRPLSIKRKPPPVPPKRWGGIWDRDTVREVLTQGQRVLEEVVEGATEISRTLRAGPSRLSGVQEEDATWETVGREDDVSFRDPPAHAWQVVGRDMPERQALHVSPPRPRRLPPPPPPLLEDVYPSEDNQDTHPSFQYEPGYLTSGQPILPLSGLPHPPAGLRSVREGLEHDLAVPEQHIYREGHVQTQVEKATPLPPSSLQRSSATRRPLSFQGRPSSRRSSLEDQSGPPDSPNPPSGATRANLKARPRHVYSSSVPSASLSSPSLPHAPPPRPRRPLPRPPVDEQEPTTSAMPSRYYGSGNTLHGFHPSHDAAGTRAFPAALSVNSSTAGERGFRQADMSAARPATGEEIESLPVGRVELERKRTDRTGKTKQKLSCVGINCNRCEICLLQFKEDELACVLPLCLHVFHAEPCTRSYLSAHSRCPTCSTPLL